MEWGRNHESIAFELYKQNKLSANSDVVVTKSGLWISPEHSFLGASPDAAIYDPSEKEPYGFAEIKRPYKHRSSSLSVACEDPNFCCRLTMVDGKRQIEIKKEHLYYSQIQGQMAVGCRSWSDFVLYILNEVHIQRIYFNVDFWKHELLPKLIHFYDNCLAPEIIHPMHILGLPIRDISKE